MESPALMLKAQNFFRRYEIKLPSPIKNINGTVSAFRYKQKQKRYRKFSPASVLVYGLRNEISLKSYYSSLKFVRSKIIFVLSYNNITKLFKNGVRKNKSKNRK
jgi:hypothetical protein